ncbi:MAG: ATP-binding protein [Chloroflexota bacterium]|nr:ATP-binding protein [Chloroflexota bacterium]
MALPLIAVGLAIGIYVKGFLGIELSRSPIRFVFCGLPLLLPFLAAAMGVWGWQRMVNPLASVMAAADALAEGDFSVRVPETGDDEFRTLAHSFNHMAEELEDNERQRRNLTADVAHELRTPLHIIQGNLEGIQDGIYEASSAHVEGMLEETRLLARLVDDLQTLSLAEAGELHLEVGEVNIADLLADVSASFNGKAQSLGVELSVELFEDAQSLTINGDWNRLDQVLSNLVVNALRYTPEGGRVSLGASSTPEGISIFVSDTGKGISSDDLPYIFNRFWKGDRARSRTLGSGSGLGLAIARQLVRSHGGEINVESELGQRTTFTIGLPS